jgi:hypothetical protein
VRPFSGSIGQAENSLHNQDGKCIADPSVAPTESEVEPVRIPQKYVGDLCQMQS